MKKVLISIILILTFGVINSQICVPDSMMQISSPYINPTPFHQENFPNGGIKDTACVGIPFQIHFDMRFPGSFGNGPVLEFEIRHLTIDPPLSNFNFSCNEEDCLFIRDETLS